MKLASFRSNPHRVLVSPLRRYRPIRAFSRWWEGMSVAGHRLLKDLPVVHVNQNNNGNGANASDVKAVSTWRRLSGLLFFVISGIHFISNKMNLLPLWAVVAGEPAPCTSFSSTPELTPYLRGRRTTCAPERAFLQRPSPTLPR